MKRRPFLGQRLRIRMKDVRVGDALSFLSVSHACCISLSHILHHGYSNKEEETKADTVADAEMAIQSQIDKIGQIGAERNKN